MEKTLLALYNTPGVRLVRGSQSELAVPEEEGGLEEPL